MVPLNVATVFEELEKPSISKSDKEIYTPEEVMRLLVFTPSSLLTWMTTGAFGGIRAAERLRLTGAHWQPEHGQFALDADITKTNKRRIVGGSAGLPNLVDWMALTTAREHELLVRRRNPYKITPQIAKNSGVRWKHNALRSSFASYHLQKYKNGQLTALLDGHSVRELEESYKGIRGVNDKTADEYASITPQTVIDYARQNGLPKPDWAEKMDIVCGGAKDKPKSNRRGAGSGGRVH